MDKHHMSPREALYTLVVELGPIPSTNRSDNITPKEARIRDAVRILQEEILEREMRSSK
jgi:hypothetical protein